MLTLLHPTKANRFVKSTKQTAICALSALASLSGISKNNLKKNSAVTELPWKRDCYPEGSVQQNTEDKQRMSQRR